MKTNAPNQFPRRKFLGLLSALWVVPALAWANDLTTAQTATAAATRSIRVACVGDSITFGAGIADRPHDSYPAVLQQRLGSGWEVRNFGHSGATLLKKGNLPFDKKKEHAQALAFAPDGVVILLGTNDSKHRGDGSLDADKAVDNWQYQADYVPNYEELIAEFRRANPAVRVYVCLPAPCFPGRWGINDRTIHDEIIPRVRQVAQAANARIIDLNTALASQKALFPDTVHPNPAGTKQMAETVYQALTANAAPAATK